MRHLPKWSKAVIITLSLGILSILLYPLVMNTITSAKDQASIDSFYTSLKQENKKEANDKYLNYIDKNHEIAKDLPNKITSFGLDEDDPQDFKNIESAKEHLMGAVIVPSISLSTPLFDSTEGNLTYLGAGHVEGSSYPTGGVPSHIVVASHSNELKRALFTNLNRIEIGDTFYISSCRKLMAYKVVSKATVSNDDTSSVHIQEGRDLATLVTCKPQQSKNARLLVTGERIDTPKDMHAVYRVGHDTVANKFMLLTLILSIAILLFAIYLFHRYTKRKHHRRN